MGKLQVSSLTPQKLDLLDRADSFVNFNLRSEVGERAFDLPFKIFNVFAYHGFAQCHVCPISCDVIVSLVAREGLGKTIFSGLYFYLMCIYV